MISLCITVKNENIAGLLKQIGAQSVLPDEIIVVDAGKTKNTNFKNKKLNYICALGNRSQGRNLAAKNAKYDALVFLDAGCKLSKNWFSEIKSAILSKDAQIIAGKYLSRPENFTEYLEDKFLNVTDYYPSARNFAIKKGVFEKLGGFDERLNHAEDLEFFTRAANAGYKIEKNEHAVVVWELPKMRQYLAKIFSYAWGDAENRVWWDARKKFQTHNIKLLLNLMRYVILVSLFLLGYASIAFVFISVYLGAVAWRRKLDFKKFAKGNVFLILRNLAVYVMVKLMTDLMSIGGFIIGFINFLRWL